MNRQGARILAESNEERQFRLIGDHVIGARASSLTSAQKLLRSADSYERAIGADIVGQAATVQEGLPASTLDLLLERLEVEPDASALAAAIIAFGHIGDVRARDSLLRLAKHDEATVRDAVAFALPAVGLDDEAIEALETLTRDPDTSVRDWATFALAESDRDDDRIRAALMDRTDDPDDDTRAEGIYGLARRQDPRALRLVERELASGSWGAMIERARDELTHGD